MHTAIRPHKLSKQLHILPSQCRLDVSGHVKYQFEIILSDIWQICPMAYGSADTEKTPDEKSNLKDQISFDTINLYIHWKVGVKRSN